MQFTDKYNSDKNFVNRIIQGDKKAWNEFVGNYSNYILSNIISWCRSTCRLLNQTEECAVESLRNNKKISNSNNSCEEGIDLYVYIFNSLKPKLEKYQGKSSLKTYITACLKFIYSDFFISKYGKINIPVALKEIEEADKKVYKILCRSKDIESASERLEKFGISKEQTLKSFNLINDLLKKDGQDKAWHHLYSQFSKNTPVEALEIKDDNGEERKQEIISFDRDYSEKEAIEMFEKSFNQLDAKQKRLLKLKFRDNVQVKEIFLQHGKLFKFDKEQDIYSELEKAIKNLFARIKEFYGEREGISGLREFKETLYDIFKVIEV